MANTASLVLSIASMTGVAATLLFGLYSIKSDDRQRSLKLREVAKKYRDPLLLAAKDLQYRLLNILQGGVLHMDVGENQTLQKHLHYYTYFLFAQLFSWVYILRRQAQFVCFSIEKENRKLV
jgi:hypothetical protein